MAVRHELLGIVEQRLSGGAVGGRLRFRRERPEAESEDSAPRRPSTNERALRLHPVNVSSELHKRPGVNGQKFDRIYADESIDEGYSETTKLPPLATNAFSPDVSPTIVVGLV